MDYCVKDYRQNYVNGKWVDGGDGERISVINPATGMPAYDITSMIAAPAFLRLAITGESTLPGVPAKVGTPLQVLDSR